MGIDDQADQRLGYFSTFLLQPEASAHGDMNFSVVICTQLNLSENLQETPPAAHISAHTPALI